MLSFGSFVRLRLAQFRLGRLRPPERNAAKESGADAFNSGLRLCTRRHHLKALYFGKSVAF
jgi:hypothetical protein